MRAYSRAIGWTLSVFGVLLLAVGGIGASPGSAGQNPGGNNGFVKVDGTDMDAGPDNDPHPGCRFVVEFYNYDEGNLNAHVVFELQPPTTRAGENQTIVTDDVAIGEDPPGGSADLDARRTYDLDIRGVQPQPAQGYHVKLTINADGSRGNNVKHKTFWVACDASSSTTTTTAPPTTTTTTPSSTTTTTPSSTTTTTPSSTTTTPTTAGTTITSPPEVLGGTPTATTPAAPEVLGVMETREPQVPRSGEPPQSTQLPRTGADGTLRGIGLAVLLAGVTMLRMSRSPGRRVSSWSGRR